MLRRLLCQMINDHPELAQQYPIDQIQASTYTDLCMMLPEVFRQRKDPSNIVICIDSIELLDNETLAHTLNFIPKDFNFDKITFILNSPRSTPASSKPAKPSRISPRST